ncbi:MAG: hypothetical protein M3Q39_01585 [Actinomycetota bacterium]|nr:hypothetical protein [Actinomycetota bacterium]
MRGSTWEDYFDYTDNDGLPIDLSAYQARMQVRTVAGQYGTTTATTLVLELLTTGASPLLQIVTPPGGATPNRVEVTAAPADHAALNPLNAKKAVYVYGLELYIPAGAAPEYVIPLVNGKLTALGEVAR